MTTPAEAEAAIADSMPAAGIQSVALDQAYGRWLARTARAERDQPPFDRVTMDGIAIRHSDFAAGTRRFAIAGTVAAGAPPPEVAGSDQCVQIMTGAVMPAGVDTVVPVERLQIANDTATIAPDATVDERQFVHPRGSDRQAGDTLIRPGTQLGPAEVAVLASAGYATVDVARKPHVAVISTGDELVGLDDPVQPYQIRSSNDFAIAAALERHGLAFVSRHRLRDDKPALLATISRLHEENDALILSGGVSMGQFDFVPAVLESLGCQLVFHRIEQKPGRPMWFGTSNQGKPVFALPGNPVSTLLCMVRYVVPAFHQAAGARQTPALSYPLQTAVRAPQHLTYFIPVILTGGAGQPTLASPRPTNTSGDFSTLAETDGFLELPPGIREHPAGTLGQLYRW